MPALAVQKEVKVQTATGKSNVVERVLVDGEPVYVQTDVKERRYGRRGARRLANKMSSGQQGQAIRSEAVEVEAL